MQKFDRSTFVSEYTVLCQSLQAPCSQAMVEQTLTAFDEYLDNAYVWLRCTSKPADVINFRLAFHGRSVDTTSITAQAGWIDINHPFAQVIRSWSSRDGAEQWCDFDPNPGRGIAKMWVYFQTLQPIEEILSVSGLPSAVAARAHDLQALGLDQVNFMAVDYGNQSMNVYFLVPGGLTSERAAKYVALAGSKPPPAADVEIIGRHANPMFTFGVTIEPETGNIPRVAFYATVDDATTFEPLKEHERLHRFFVEAPSHDPKQLHILSWSYGAGDSKTYMKGEASYAGYQEALSRDMFVRWTEEST